ncbi:hypothetical protein CP157_03901 (plasmid) [Paracoccus marcusii]|uniref:TIGR02594 family protein n=1 Tax=Paracoccus marcusii TaxID=59779 RepID=UPI001C3D3319|nr:TIGR02594 family protein [Paracoccus marcusii]QXI66109.1 hypothetical protein CP157_03901 [Paracoccus marcusii]
MVSRRNAIGALTLSVPSILFYKSANAVPDTFGALPPFPLPAETPVPTLDAIQQAATETGIAAPYLEEIALGRRILQESPTTDTPFKVAQYFQLLRHGEHQETFGREAALYAEEWPERANPVIVSFFDATQLRTPKGDTTAWCAAFVNWCYNRSRGSSPTNSAAAQSFRNWGEATDNPKPGDIVVFVHKTVDWRGHVGFYIAQQDDGIFVLGGNQRPSDSHNTGEVNVSLYRRDGSSLRFHSFRTAPELH